MTSSTRDLAQWLEYQETLNPSLMDLGLDRLRPVARRLRLDAVGCPLISVAGTNGKGSTVAFLEAMAVAHGLRVGAYGSPHLEHYGECVRLDGNPCDDAGIIAAFEAVEAVRGGVPLTAFEFRTLAAIHQLRTLQPELMVLEVGLGGRLDAVNILDADVAVVSAIGLDHQQWLGDTLEQVAMEKCGIARRDRLLVCADGPSLLLLRPEAGRIGARLFGPGCGLTVEIAADSWSLGLPERSLTGLPLPCLEGAHQITNAAGAISAFALVQGAGRLNVSALGRALTRTRLRGRLQRLRQDPLCVVDVAHNPHACAALARWIRERAEPRAWRGVCAMYQDKDAAASLAELTPWVGEWFVASLPPPRGAPAHGLRSVLAGIAPAAEVSSFDRVDEAWSAAVTDAGSGHGVLGFGSFETVRRILALESASG